MKKIVCVIMATLMLLALVGCGGSTTSTETSTTPSETAKTAIFEVKNIEVYRRKSSPTLLAFGLYCKELDKAIVIYDAWLNDYINFYGQYSEGDYVKVTWEEDEKGEVIKSSLIFEKVSNELVPIKDVGGG